MCSLKYLSEPLICSCALWVSSSYQFHLATKYVFLHSISQGQYSKKEHNSVTSLHCLFKTKDSSADFLSMYLILHPSPQVPVTPVLFLSPFFLPLLLFSFQNLRWLLSDCSNASLVSGSGQGSGKRLPKTPVLERFTWARGWGTSIRQVNIYTSELYLLVLFYISFY